MRIFIWNLILVLSFVGMVSCEDSQFLPEELIESGTYLGPNSLLSPVQSYVDTYFPNQSIHDTELDEECEQTVYEVELSNGVYLHFDLQGNFLGTDATFDCDDDDYVDPASLPASTLTYLAANYPNDGIDEVERVEECGQEVYEVKLNSGLELYFDLQGNFLGTDATFDCDDDDDVDPASLPASTLTYLAANYPNDGIDEVERVEECGQEVYEVKLNSGLELYFDLQGNFLGTDATFDCDDD